MAVRHGYKQTEVGVIPEDWNVKLLAGLAVILHGFGFQSRHFSQFGKYRLTTPGHFFEIGGFRDVGDKQKFYDGPLPTGYLLNEGDLIVAMTEQADGLLGSAALVPTGGTYLHNQRLGKVKVLSSEVSTRFLYRVFNSKAYRAKVRETAAGTKVKHTSPSKLLEIPVALPPTRAEQGAIAEALSDADALIESLEQLLAKNRQLKQGAMQELLTGKKRLPGFCGEWEVRPLGAEVTAFDAGVSVNSMDDTADSDSGAPSILKTSCVDRGVFTPTECKRIASKDVYRAKLNPRADSILISRMNTIDLVGECGYVDANYPHLFVPDRLWLTRFRRGSDVSAKWLTYILSSEHYRALLKAAATGTSGSMKNIAKGALLSLEVTFPPGPEQTAIAAILSDMDTEIVALEAKLTKARQIKQGMMQELLTGRIRLV